MEAIDLPLANQTVGTGHNRAVAIVPFLLENEAMEWNNKSKTCNGFSHY